MRWSFSQWETYNSCPAKWKYRYVDKLPSQPPGPAAARGLSMHDRSEAYIMGQIDSDTLTHGDLTKRFGSKKEAVVHPKYIPVLDRFREHENGDRWTEHRLGFDNEWYLSGGISKTAWCIGVLDAVRYTNDFIVDIGEWKSGTPKDTHAEQRKMYALMGLRKWGFGQLKEVRGTTYYLEDTAEPARLVVKPTAEQKLRDLWNGRVEQMVKDQICAPKPNEGCRWCDYAKSKGGPCPFGN
jgi:hypothetical protein